MFLAIPSVTQLQTERANLAQNHQIIKLSLPGLVNVLASKDLALLKQDHRAPRRVIDSIHITARLHTESSTLSVGRSTINGRNVNVLSSVELECRLSTVDFEMEAGIGMAELSQAAQGQTTGIERDLGGISLHDEDVIDVWTSGLELEQLGHVARELGDSGFGDAG